MASHVAREERDDLLAGITEHAPWDVWAGKLAERKKPEPLHKLVGHAKTSPLLWSLSDGAEADVADLILSLQSLRKRRHKGEVPADWALVATEWMERFARQPQAADQALLSLAWTHALPRLAVRLSAETWSELFATLINSANDAVAVRATTGAAEDFLLSQLIAGELAMTLAYVFPKVEVCQQLGQAGRRVIEEGILAALDGEGMPHARFVPVWHRLLACWVRARYLDGQLKGKQIQADSRLQLEWLVRQTVRWSRADGSVMLGSETTNAGLLAAALEVAGDKLDNELFAIQQRKLKADDSEFAIPTAAEHSEWAESALLRTDWSPTAPSLALTFETPKIHSELNAAGHVIWSGATLPEIQIEHQRVEPRGEWDELCWSSDDDMDYLELEIELNSQWRLQRQLLLAREDQFLLMADILLGEELATVDYRLELPVMENISSKVPDETTEVHWHAGKKWLGCVMPLALCEWNTDRSAGGFDGRTLHQIGRGAGLYAPLMIDLAPQRRRKPRTWRQLTVAEQLELLPRDRVVAYRIQVGDEQWIVYRSLCPPGNRTFLGHNLISEFLVGRFEETGEIDELIEIE